MDKTHESAIAKLVEHRGGPVALSQLMGGSPAYQEIQRWVKRGWASPMHLFSLERFMPRGMKVRDLNNDRAVAAAAITAELSESAKAGA